MRGKLIYLVCFMLMPCLSTADEVLYQDGAKLDLNSDPTPQTASIQSGSVSLNFSDQSIQSIALANYPTDVKPSLFVGVAEASAVPPDTLMRDFLNAQRKIQQAKSLKDLDESATASYIKPLQDKVAAGANERIVLSMLQTIRPENVQIKDTRSQKDQGKITLAGDSAFGKVQGVVYMVRENNTWKIDRENWFSDQKSKIASEKDLLSTMNIPEPLDNPIQYASYSDLESPDYHFNRNVLNLRTAHPNIRKRSFMFIFYVEKKDHLKEHLADPDDKGVFAKRPAPLHVLWTGPRSMVPEQTVVKYDYPINFSLADDNDGFMPGGMNLQLPKKRPNGVSMSVMMTF